MNQIKRLLGLVWIALAVATAYFCIDILRKKLTSGKQEDLVFGIIIFSTCLSFRTRHLGYFSLMGDYDEDS
jgi:uncharacterized membrane protein